jgi:hypothetical protein
MTSPTTVTTDATGRVKPWLYFKPMAHEISKSDAMKRMIQGKRNTFWLPASNFQLDSRRLLGGDARHQPHQRVLAGLGA